MTDVVMPTDGEKTAGPAAKRAARARRQGFADAGRAARLLARFTKGRHRTFLLALGMLIFEAATAVFEAYPLAYLIDYLKGDRGGIDVPLLGSERASTVLVLTGAIVAIAMINSLADSLAEIYLARGGRTLGFQLRVTLFAHLQRLSLAFHDRRRTGDVITRVTGDVKQLEEFVINSVSDLAGSLLLLVGVLAFLAFNSWQVTLVALLAVPFLALVSAYFSRRIKAAARRQRAREGDLASATQEMLTSIRVVQTFGRARHDEKRFAGQSGEAMDAALDAARLEAWFSWVVSVLEALTIAVVIWLGLWLIDQGAITVGTLVLFTILIGRMFKPIRKIIKEWNTIAKVYASVERIADLLDRDVAVRDEPGAVPAPRLEGEIEFRDVTFAYEVEPEDAREGEDASQLRPSLRNLSFRIAPGEVVALVGASGAGKTTIAQLVPRLYDPQEGEVLLDGQNVRAFTLESIRAQISMVLQETVLFSGTVAENIAYGRADATREEIVRAAVRANAHQFIEEMPGGYDTELTERASNLSGGQRQRIAIARAFIRDTPILILDEPTTGLDGESTDLVVHALGTLMRGKTTFVISHDPSLIRAADRIVVLSAGELVEDGTHESLLARGAVYAQLYAKRFGEADGDFPPPDAAEHAPTDDSRPVRSGRSRAAASELAEYDPLRSAALREELPALGVALDGARMRLRLEDVLTAGKRDRWEIERCTAGKALYVPGEGCRVRYRLDVRDKRSALRGTTLVGGRLFPQVDAAVAFLAERLAPLAGRVGERREVEPFVSPVAAFDDPPMAVHAFPIDPDLPSLVDVSDAERMAGLLAEMLGEVGDEGTRPDACRVEVARYARRGRCVLRYVLGDPSAAPSDRAARVLFGKVGASNGSDAQSVLSSLRERVLGNGAPHPVRIPRPVGFHPELGLLLVVAVTGAPRIVHLLRLCTGGSSSGVAWALERAVDASAGAAAALHGSGLDVGRARTLADDVRAIRGDLAVVHRLAPAFGDLLEHRLEQIVAHAGAADPLSLVLSHGDYTPSQVLFAGDTAGLIDFDAVCQAEPALDLGRFCAYLRAACRKAAPAGGTSAGGFDDALCERFVRSYARTAGLAGGPAPLQARVAAYEALSLLRMALRSWHQLKPERTAIAVSILEERMGCLGRP